MASKIEVPRELLEVLSMNKGGLAQAAALHELRALLAAPEAARLKSSADAGGMVTVEIPAVIHANGRIEISSNERGVIGEITQEHRPVALPIRQPEQDCSYTNGWNACLDKVKELNQ